MSAAAQQLWLEDFAPGQGFEGEPHRLDEAMFADFARITGDAHPIHYDVAYAAQSRFGARVAHGLLLTACTALGATALSARLHDSLVAFVEQGMRFLKPVKIGETVLPRLVVESVERRPGARSGRLRFRVELLGAQGEPVAEGFHDYLLKCRTDA